MARQLTTKAQVNGYRFLLRRLEHALVRRDVKMIHDPMQSQFRSLMIGFVVAVLVVAGCLILSFFRPQGAVGDAKIVMGKDTGALYVVQTVDGVQTLYPALNLASARLIVGAAAKPTSVKDSKLRKYPRGSLVGIPGAPASLDMRKTSQWNACEQTKVRPGATLAAAEETLSVIAGAPALRPSTVKAAADNAALVALVGVADTYLLFDGHRARVDIKNSALVNGLGIESVEPRPISVEMLNTFPEIAPLTVPTIPKVGLKSVKSNVDNVIGDVVKTVSASGETRYFVILDDGVQRIPLTAADTLWAANQNGSAGISQVSQESISAAPESKSLRVEQFPELKPKIADYKQQPVLCLNWEKTSTGTQTRLLVGQTVPISEGKTMKIPVSAIGTEGGIDQIYAAPGQGYFVQSTGVEQGSPRAESLFFVNDSGVRFGVPSLDVAAILGVGRNPESIPWSIATLLIAGPTLSVESARVQHDSIAADSAGQPLPESEK